METSSHIDTLDQRESLKSPLVISVGLHLAVFGAVFAYTTLNSRGRVQWGDPNALGGGGVTIGAVKQIPMPSHGGAVNPVAVDTESTVPAAPKPEPKRAKPAPAPEAVPLRSSSKAKEAPKPTYSARQYVRPEGYRSNQLYSQSGAALSSPMFGSVTGSGGVGIGPGGAFGNRFGWYQKALQDAIAARWHPEAAGGGGGQPAILTFDIVRPNQARSVRVLQSSGNRQLDYAAQRAIMEAAIPPLPPQYERDTAEIEIWFQVKR